MRAARWLMEHFGIAEPIVGDVVEESVRRPPSWIWTQALSAILRAIAHDLLAHPVVAVRAILIAWVEVRINRDIE